MMENMEKLIKMTFFLFALDNISIKHFLLSLHNVHFMSLKFSLILIIVIVTRYHCSITKNLSNMRRKYQSTLTWNNGKFWTTLPAPSLSAPLSHSLSMNG